MKNLRSILVCLAVTGAGGAAPEVASAAFLSIDDTSPADTITINVNDFEGGFSVNGSLIQSGLSSPASLTLAESAGLINFSGSWIDLGGASGSYRVAFVEPGDPTIVSDILNVDYSSAGGFGTITGNFISDVNNNLGLISDPAYNGYTVYVENPRGFDFSTAFLSASATSDVPEPASLALLGLGLAGLGFSRRRTTRTA